MDNINRLKERVKAVYLKIYYITEDDYKKNDADKADIDEAVMKLIDSFEALSDTEKQQIPQVEQIYYNDIITFWNDKEKLQNRHHAWLILAEYIPAMY